MDQNDRMKKMLSNGWVVCLIAICCCFLWGSAFPSIKIGYQLFHIQKEAWNSQILFAGIRFTLAALMVILFGSFQNKKILFPEKDSWGRIFLVGLFQVVIQYIFFYIGLAHASGVKSSIIEASNVFFAILFAGIVFRQEKISPRKIAGTLIGFSGVLYVNLSGGNGLDFHFTLAGEGFVLISTVAASLAVVLTKKFTEKDNPVTLCGYQFLMGGLILMVLGAATGGQIGNADARGWLLMIYMAFISAAAYSLWSVLLKYNPVSRVSIYGFSNPVFGVILSGLLLNEGKQAFGYQNIIALLLVSIGIYIVNASFETGRGKRAAWKSQ